MPDMDEDEKARWDLQKWSLIALFILAGIGLWTLADIIIVQVMTEILDAVW